MTVTAMDAWVTARAGNLESLEPAAPHTPVCVWYDNLTDSDKVVKGENTPFAMLSSPYGRFIYARRDSQRDSGAPLVSVVSYTTARAYNESFQSIRELTGSDDFKMNTFVNGAPVELRWTGDIQDINVITNKAIVIHWKYTKGDVPSVEYEVTTTLSSYGVLLEKSLKFTANASASVTMIHHINVQENSPAPLSDNGTRVETDEADALQFPEADAFRFQSNNPVATAVVCKTNNTLIFIASDGYALGIKMTSVKPDIIKVFDKAAGSPFETLEFD